MHHHLLCQSFGRKQRCRAAIERRIQIATLDLNTMTFRNETVINTPRNVRIMAQAIYDCGVKPEIELFGSGDIELARNVRRRIAAHACDGVAGAWRKLRLSC